MSLILNFIVRTVIINNKIIISPKNKDLNKSIGTNKETLENMDVNELQKIYRQNQQNKKEQNLQKKSDFEL